MDRRGFLALVTGMLVTKPLGNLGVDLFPGKNIAADFAVSAAGDIRYVGRGTSYTVLELHRWLQELADREMATPEHRLDITDHNPSVRTSDTQVTLRAGYNIDDRTAEHLREGTICQGDTMYTSMDTSFHIVDETA